MAKIIGIDVGTNNLAVAILQNGKLTYFNAIKNNIKDTQGEKLFNIEEFLRIIFKKEKPDYIVVEGTFWNPKEARGYSSVSAAIGIIQKVAWETMEKDIIKIQPASVKKTVTGNGRAKKEEVAEKIKEIFKIKQNLSDHKTDAIAIAYSFYLKKEVA